LEVAAGDYVAVLDSGSVLDADHLERLVARLEDGEGVSVAYAGARLVGGTVRNAPFDRGRLLAEAYIPLGAVLFERQLAEAGCRFDPGLGDDADRDFLLQLSGRAEYVHEDHVSATLPGAAARQSGAALLGKWAGALSADDAVDLAASRARLQEAFDAQARELAGERGRLEQLQLKNARLQQDLARMARSRSWRLTAPLRRAAAGLAALVGLLRRGGKRKS
jgi:hypothetical protein